MQDVLFDWALIPLVKIAVVLGIVLGVVAYLTLLERKVIAFMQVRLGPRRVGPHGLLQPIADVLKLLIKEDVIPRRADRFVFTLAPALALGPALLAFAVVPFSGTAGSPPIAGGGRSVAPSVTHLKAWAPFPLSVP